MFILGDLFFNSMLQLLNIQIFLLFFCLKQDVQP